MAEKGAIVVCPNSLQLQKIYENSSTSKVSR